MGSVSTPFAPLVNATTGLKPVRRLLDLALKNDRRRSLPGMLPTALYAAESVD